MVFLISLLFSLTASAKTLHMKVAATPITLDWTGQVTVAEAPIIVNLCEGLFIYEYPSEKLTPRISSSLKKSKDLTEYTFKISDDAKWSDGRAVYAKDFVDGWQRLISPQSTSIYYYYLFDIKNAREYHANKVTSFDDVGIHAIDDKTLVVKFNKPQKNWEVNTTFWPLFPVRKDLIEKFGNNWWRAGTLVSSGPFVITEYEPGKKAVLKKNSFYKKTNSNIDDIEISFISDQAEAIKKYEENYFPFISGVKTEKYIKSADYHTMNLLRHFVIAMNSERFPFNNKFFRLALFSSIDRSKLLPDGIPLFTLANNLVPHSLLKNSEDLSVPYDPKKAKEYLEKSGVQMGKGFKISFLTGLSEPYYGASKKMASQIESALKIPVDLLAYESQEFETFSNLGEYNMLMSSWTAKVRTPQDFLFPYSSSYSNRNRTHYINEDYDRAIESGDFKKAQLIISKENGVLHPLFFQNGSYLAHKNIKNIYFDYLGLPILKYVILK